MSTENDEYQPTVAEKKLLKVLLDPDKITLSITDVCKEAEIDRTHYYKIFRKKAFVDHYKDIALDLVKTTIAPVINSAAKEAKKGSFQHQKMLLEMAEMHVDRKELNHKGIKVTISPDDADSL